MPPTRSRSRERVREDASINEVPLIVQDRTRVTHELLSCLGDQSLIRPLLTRWGGKIDEGAYGKVYAYGLVACADGRAPLDTLMIQKAVVLKHPRLEHSDREYVEKHLPQFLREVSQTDVEARLFYETGRLAYHRKSPHFLNFYRVEKHVERYPQGGVFHATYYMERAEKDFERVFRRKFNEVNDAFAAEHLQWLDRLLAGQMEDHAHRTWKELKTENRQRSNQIQQEISQLWNRPLADIDHALIKRKKQERSRIDQFNTFIYYLGYDDQETMREFVSHIKPEWLTKKRNELHAKIGAFEAAMIFFRTEAISLVCQALVALFTLWATTGYVHDDAHGGNILFLPTLAQGFAHRFNDFTLYSRTHGRQLCLIDFGHNALATTDAKEASFRGDIHRMFYFLERDSQYTYTPLPEWETFCQRIQQGIIDNETLQTPQDALPLLADLTRGEQVDVAVTDIYEPLSPISDTFYTWDRVYPLVARPCTDCMADLVR